MKFECKDLERALAVQELMPDAREHARHCEECRRQLWLWGEMSSTASQLHVEWESPDLWPRIQQALAAESAARKPRASHWRWALPLAAAAAVVVAVGLWMSRPAPPAQPASPDFLTEQALREVRQAETAYLNSIEKLSRLANPKLERATSPLSTTYREKLIVLDSAIRDLRGALDRNPYNAYLRTELASLYHEKQQTLEEILHREQIN